MPDTPETEKPKRKPRQIKDAGERTVLAAVEYDSHEVAAKLAEAQGIDLAGLKNDAERKKAIQPFLDKLDVLDGGGVLVWVKVGQVKADERGDAVDAVVGADVPGSFRAPTASSWRGQINRRPPEQVPLDIEMVD